jgi:2-oxoglutarate ferredoxin oxidoreductase subunit gamma
VSGVEREILMTGIGGQGVQLAAQVLARAAVLEGRHVLLLGTYGGSMRGGNTDTTLIVADAAISAPPIVAHAWAALVMHPQFWPPLAAKLRPDGVLLVNGSLVEDGLDRATQRVVAVPATAIARDLGNPMTASMVLIGAFARLTGIVALASLVGGMHESVPSYRRQHIQANERALRAGFDAAAEGIAPAWPAEAAA